MRHVRFLALVAAVAVAPALVGCSNPGGPTPWFTVVDNTFVAAEGTGDPNMTFGTLERFEADGTAVFHVHGGRWSVHFSTDQAEASWIIEGCA